MRTHNRFSAVFEHFLIYASVSFKPFLPALAVNGCAVVLIAVVHTVSGEVLAAGNYPVFGCKPAHKSARHFYNVVGTVRHCPCIYKRIIKIVIYINHRSQKHMISRFSEHLSVNPCVLFHKLGVIRCSPRHFGNLLVKVFNPTVGKHHCRNQGIFPRPFAKRSVHFKLIHALAKRAYRCGIYRTQVHFFKYSVILGYFKIGACQINVQNLPAKLIKAHGLNDFSYFVICFH